MTRPVVFTDLDGTLLDHATYSWAPALPALRLLHEQDVPVVFCSSKTRTEIEHYRCLIGNDHPFISENGGGIFIPDSYFEPATLSAISGAKHESGYWVIRLGAPYHRLRQALQELREEGFALTGFGDMTAAEVARLTGLPPEQAAMAKQRDFDEPFILDDGAIASSSLEERIRAKGFHSTRGALAHILGNSDKGVAVGLLAGLFREKFGAVSIIALGDSPNDLPMLERADRPVVIRKADGRHDSSLDIAAPLRTEAIGPAGWNEAIVRLLGDFRGTAPHRE